MNKKHISIISRRDFLKYAASLGAAPLLSSCGVKKNPLSGDSNPIFRENERPGTREWMLTNTRTDPRTQVNCPWIEGYCSRTSVRAGEKISFFVSTDPVSSFTLDIYRMGYYGAAGHRTLIRRLAGATSLVWGRSMESLRHIPRSAKTVCAIANGSRAQKSPSLVTGSAVCISANLPPSAKACRAT